MTIPPLAHAFDDDEWRRAAVRVERIPGNRHRTAYHLARDAPGEYYFPWNTLSSVLGEGAFYHSSYGLFDLNLAGFLPERRSLAMHFSPRLNAVLFHKQRQDLSVLLFLEEFRSTVVRPDLPDWVVYVRGPGER
jgi:hypothetical protein